MLLPLGQGKPLPRDFGYEGQWLIENLLFLYTDFDGQRIDGTAPRFTAVGPVAGGKVSIGFDAAQIASALHVSTEDVMAANESGRLTIVGVEDTVSPSGVVAKRYTFSIGGRQCALTMHANQNAGTA